MNWVRTAASILLSLVGLSPSSRADDLLDPFLGTPAFEKQRLFDDTPSSGWVYLHYEHDPFKGAHMARFNLAWLLGGEATGGGEVPTLKLK